MPDTTKFGPWTPSRGAWIRPNLGYKDTEWPYYHAPMLDTDSRGVFSLSYFGDQVGPEIPLKTICLAEAFEKADRIIRAEHGAELT